MLGHPANFQRVLVTTTNNNMDVVEDRAFVRVELQPQGWNIAPLLNELGPLCGAIYVVRGERRTTYCTTRWPI
jgi:hypothetical protein